MRIFILATFVAAFAGASAAQTAAPTPPSPPIIDGAALVGPPPAPGSARDAGDRLSMHPQVSADRLAQARTDQQFSAWQMFQPVLGANFTEANLPRTAAVLRAVSVAVAPPTNAAKTAHPRTRPFADRSVIQCDDPGTNITGSYPSGHGSGSWALALTLAELLPTRADAILQRGREFGESRVICGYHFPTDIEASRLIGAGVVARLHANADFRRDLETSRRELARAYQD